MRCCFILLFGSTAIAATTPDGSIPESVMNAYQSLTKVWQNAHQDEMCYYRARFWQFQLKQYTNLTRKNVILYYTNDQSIHDWSYHVAPAIEENGEVYILEPSVWIKSSKPLTIQDWMKELGVQCEPMTEEWKLEMKARLGGRLRWLHKKWHYAYSRKFFAGPCTYEIQGDNIFLPDESIFWDGYEQYYDELPVHQACMKAFEWWYEIPFAGKHGITEYRTDHQLKTKVFGICAEIITETQQKGHLKP